MKNNYKQLSPLKNSTTTTTLKNKISGNNFSSSTFKRSASHALRSSFRIPAKNKRSSSQFHALNLDQLPSTIPPKALRLLQIDIPRNGGDNNSSTITTMSLSNQIKIATIRKRSVWANASVSK